jgi:rSAM/selenodomain-associated transferase 1
MVRATSSAVLVVFARQPTPGEVKTRLADRIGDERAAALYAAFVADLARRLRAASVPVCWAVAPPLEGFAERFGLAPRDCLAQPGGDLGARMHAAFLEMSRRGFSRCALIGSDLPQLPLERVERSLGALDEADLVLGPARDGGYYLIAMREPRDVFTGIRWSSAGVLDATLARAESLGLRAALLEEDFDVDTAEDLDRLRALLASRPEVRGDLPATAAALGLSPRG